MSNAGGISEKKRRRSRKRRVKVESYVGGIPILFCCICTWDIIMFRLPAFCCSSTVPKGVKNSTQFEAIQVCLSVRVVSPELKMHRIPCCLVNSLVFHNLCDPVVVDIYRYRRRWSFDVPVFVVEGKSPLHKNGLDRTAYETTIKIIPANYPPNGDDGRVTLMVSVPHFSPHPQPARQKPVHL